MAESNGMDSSSPQRHLSARLVSVQPPVNEEEESTMKVSRIGVDLAKNVFQLHGVDRHDRVVFKRRLKRNQWLRVLLDNTEADCMIGMEACAGAHHWARELQSRGYRVRLIPPQFVTPYVKSNKNDANDAEAICEAMSRPNMRFVAVKSVGQQDTQATHRIRAELMTQRTAKANQIRGLVTEYGLVAPQHLSSLRSAIPCWLEDAENGLTIRFRALLHALWQDLIGLDERVAALDAEIEVIAKTDPLAQRLQQLRGVGPLIATALVASVGTGQQFGKGRQMAAALGLTPKQHSSGNRERLSGISKRGDVYLRSILIHGARSVVSHAKHKDDRLSRWVTQLAERRHPNVAAVALANKTVRMAWAMMRNESDYDPEFVVA
jgi:transposase